MDNSTPESTTQITRRAFELLRERFPVEWELREAEVEPELQGFRPDASLLFTTPEGQSVWFDIHAKRLVARRDVARLAQQLAPEIKNRHGRRVAVLAARYLSPTARADVDEAGVSYVDATGNMRVHRLRVYTSPIVEPLAIHGEALDGRAEPSRVNRRHEWCER